MSRFINVAFFVALATISSIYCGGAHAQSLFVFFNAPVRSQMAPQLQITGPDVDTSNRDALTSTHLRRQIVDYPSREARGTVIIDTPHTYLYYVLGNGKAIRYGIGVGREGFTWSGVKNVTRKAEWPDWYPPARMIARQPYLPRMVAGGPGNPLGARTMYIGDTEYRIHGTNDPTTIGKHVSSGCIRLTNEDVKDLYSRVQIGAKVIVLPQTMQAKIQDAANDAYAQAPRSRAAPISIHPAPLY